MVTHGNPYMSCPWDLKQEFGPLKDLEALENIMSFSSWGLLGQNCYFSETIIPQRLL